MEKAIIIIHLRATNDLPDDMPELVYAAYSVPLPGPAEDGGRQLGELLGRHATREFLAGLLAGIAAGRD